MQEAEPMERVEQLFALALVGTYRRDALITLHHTLRQIWQNLAQSADGSASLHALSYALHEVEDACLLSLGQDALAEADRAVLSQIQEQCILLQEQLNGQ